MTRQTEQTELGRRMKEEIGGGVCVGRGGGGGGGIKWQRWDSRDEETYIPGITLAWEASTEKEIKL